MKGVSREVIILIVIMLFVGALFFIGWNYGIGPLSGIALKARCDTEVFKSCTETGDPLAKVSDVCRAYLADKEVSCPT